MQQQLESRHRAHKLSSSLTSSDSSDNDNGEDTAAQHYNLQTTRRPRCSKMHLHALQFVVLRKQRHKSTLWLALGLCASKSNSGASRPEHTVAHDTRFTRDSSTISHSPNTSGLFADIGNRTGNTNTKTCQAHVIICTTYMQHAKLCTHTHTLTRSTS